MAIIVHKYGGTSMGSVERIKNVARRVAKWHDAGYQMVVVVSAMSGETNRLIGLAKEIMPDPDPRELDVIASTGEQVSIGLLAMALKARGVDAVSFNGSQVAVHTDSAYTKARIESIDSDRIKKELDAGRVVIVAGFQGIDSLGNVTTLGRGGSDTTAVAIAAGIQADVCEIYTDVEGVYSADPRVVPHARKIDTISYEEMLEMAASGAGVLHKRSVEFARNFNVIVNCRSSFSDNPGTIVKEKDIDMEKAIVSGVAHDLSEAKLTLRDVPDTTGVAATVFGAMADEGLAVDMIIQNVSENGHTDISFTTPVSDLPRAREVMQQLVRELGARELIVADQVAKISIVGAGMKVNSGVAALMFRTLADEGINITMISTSDIRTSVVIPADRAEDAVRHLHTAFGLDASETFEETQLSAAEIAAKAEKGR